jgi:hypothetical protein
MVAQTPAQSTYQLTPSPKELYEQPRVPPTNQDPYPCLILPIIIHYTINRQAPPPKYGRILLNYFKLIKIIKDLIKLHGARWLGA